MENCLLETFNGTRQNRGIYSSSLLYSGSDLSRQGSACQPHLLSMIRAKDLLLPRSEAPSKHRKKATRTKVFPRVTCVSCLLLLSFSVRELSCALILSLALCSSLAESTASSFALRSTSMWRCWDSIRCCREEEEERCWVFISILFLLHLLFTPFVPCSQDSCCPWSNRRKYTQ